MEERSGSEEEEGSSEEDPKLYEEYFYPDVRKIVGTEEWDLKEKNVSHKEVDEVERTVDTNVFRRHEPDEGVNRGETPKHNVDWPNDRNSSLKSSAGIRTSTQRNAMSRETEICISIRNFISSI